MKKVVWIILVVLLAVFFAIFCFSLRAQANGHYGGHHYIAGSNFWAGFLVGMATSMLIEMLSHPHYQSPRICGQWVQMPITDAYGNILSYGSTWVQLPCD